MTPLALLYLGWLFVMAMIHLGVLCRPEPIDGAWHAHPPFGLRRYGKHWWVDVPEWWGR